MGVYEYGPRRPVRVEGGLNCFAAESSWGFMNMAQEGL